MISLTAGSFAALLDRESWRSEGEKHKKCLQTVSDSHMVTSVDVAVRFHFTFHVVGVFHVSRLCTFSRSLPRVGEGMSGHELCHCVAKGKVPSKRDLSTAWRLPLMDGTSAAAGEKSCHPAGRHLVSIQVMFLYAVAEFCSGMIQRSKAQALHRQEIVGAALVAPQGYSARPCLSPHPTKSLTSLMDPRHA